jgi:uncharacterized protein (DUF697 family)
MAWRDRLRRWLAPHPPVPDAAEIERQIAELREKTPSPVFWLFGKTQSGKSSVVRFLTGATDATIGNGFRPCTRTSREFPFPDAEAPVLRFLDTRGVDEPGYDPSEDLQAFESIAQLIIVTVRVTDFATANLRTALSRLRAGLPTRPVVLVLTCLHEARPQEQHPQPYPFPNSDGPDEWRRAIAQQRGLFAGLFEAIVPVDLTKPEEGYTDPVYGGEFLKSTLLDKLPSAYQSLFQRIQSLQLLLRDSHMAKSRGRILEAVSLAAASGAAPIPGSGIVLLPEIQLRMLNEIAATHEAPESVAPFLAGFDASLRRKQAWRELVKLIPGIGAAASAALAARATYALGVAFSEYVLAERSGQFLSHDEIRHLYDDQFQRAAQAWGKS